VGYRVSVRFINRYFYRPVVCRPFGVSSRRLATMGV